MKTRKVLRNVTLTLLSIIILKLTFFKHGVMHNHTIYGLHTLSTEPIILDWHDKIESLRYDCLEEVKHFQDYGRDRRYGSHLLPLLAAACVTDGPIFEMGSGNFSTPMLSKIAHKRNRFVLTADTDKEWLDNFRVKYEGEDHMFVHVPLKEGSNGDEWNDVGQEYKWSLVLIDHIPGERRGIDLQRFREKADLIVVHDTQVNLRKHYGYEDQLETFLGCFTVQKLGAWTTVVSDLHPELVAEVENLVNWAFQANAKSQTWKKKHRSH